MKGVIFDRLELPFWVKIEEGVDKLVAEVNLPEDMDFTEYKKHFILQILKSYKPSPNGSGIKWSKEERSLCEAKL